ncbi:MAG: hypothetical protein WBA05_02410 [Gordonia sp. (in: high G+C Gram-positive bacteria)]|uniref:hypothetical protein n=1 Tax=Gordonia sp. (in: high G+C Gram-positive bacteria) TaxID=84139 RepID=UPI003C785FD6
MSYTTPDAALDIAGGLSAPEITSDKVADFIEANVLANLSGTSNYELDRQEVARFISDVRYFPKKKLQQVRDLHPRGMVYRVSSHPRTPRQSGGYATADGTHYPVIGVDYAANPVSADELGGWCGVWPVKEQKVRKMIKHRALILSSLRGYVGPGHLRAVVDAEKIGSRWFFHTEPAPAKATKFLGKGIILQIPGGPISNFV